MAALDKVFVTTSWDQKYSRSLVKSLPRGCSDHTPMLIDLGVSKQPKEYNFRFEKWWLQQEGFYSIVEEVWQTVCSYTNPLDVWQFKIRLLRKKLKGWSKNLNANLKKKKKDLLQEFDILDVFSEQHYLSESEKSRMKEIASELENICKK